MRFGRSPDEAANPSQPYHVESASRLAAGTGPRLVANGADRPHLYAAQGGWRNPRRQLNRFVQITRLDQVGPRHLFLRLGERTVDDRALVAFVPDAQPLDEG